MMEIVGIKFDGNSKVYYFDANGLVLKKNLTVIVETEKGLQFGTVNMLDVENTNEELELKKVLRIATKKDFLKHKKNISDAKYAMDECSKMIEKENLNMKLLGAEYTFDRGQLIFKFISDDRVDFRKLAKDLGSKFKTRIELRQVGIRDKAKEVGGIGPCGRKLCCNSFLTEFNSVSINMAKNQNLSLNPNKINGVCGRLLCCLNYENDTYSELKKELPELNKSITIKGKSGKVTEVNILNKSYKVLFSDNTVEEFNLEDESKK